MTTVSLHDYAEKELGVCRGGILRKKWQEVHLKGKGNEKGGNDIKGFDAEGWRGSMHVVVASISRGNLGMVWGDCHHHLD